MRSAEARREANDVERSYGPPSKSGVFNTSDGNASILANRQFVRVSNCNLMAAGGQATLGKGGNDGQTRPRPGTPMPSPVSLEDLVISERFVRASGPGGQNVNKVATAVQLRVDLRASLLPEAIRKRLIALAGRQVTGDAVLVIVSRVHRTQAMNRRAARTRLA